jgi:hypothetical protein
LTDISITDETVAPFCNEEYLPYGSGEFKQISAVGRGSGVRREENSRFKVKNSNLTTEAQRRM